MKDINVVGNKMTRNGCEMTISKSCIFFNQTDFIPPLTASRGMKFGEELQTLAQTDLSALVHWCLHANSHHQKIVFAKNMICKDLMKNN